MERLKGIALKEKQVDDSQSDEEEIQKRSEVGDEFAITVRHFRKLKCGWFNKP